MSKIELLLAWVMECSWSSVLRSRAGLLVPPLTLVWFKGRSELADVLVSLTMVMECF